jgi:acetyl-CoA carboxylase biotin carboxyl carrier protein
MTPEESDLKRIKELIQVMEDHDLVEIQIEHGDDKVCLKRSHPPVTGMTALPMFSPGMGTTGLDSSSGKAGLQTPPASQEAGLVEIKAPLVGTFYQAASPDSDPYVEVGSHIDPQTVVCIIEAMKVMNEIKAETSGTIVAVLATNGQAAQYGQPLFKVKPD